MGPRLSKLSELSELSALSVPGSLDPWIAGCLTPGLPGYAWLPRSLAPWLPGSLASCHPGGLAPEWPETIPRDPPNPGRDPEVWPQGGRKCSRGRIRRIQVPEAENARDCSHRAFKGGGHARSIFGTPPLL